MNIFKPIKKRVNQSFLDFNDKIALLTVRPVSLPASLCKQLISNQAEVIRLVMLSEHGLSTTYPQL